MIRSRNADASARRAHDTPVPITNCPLTHENDPADARRMAAEKTAAAKSQWLMNCDQKVNKSLTRRALAASTLRLQMR